MSAVTASASGKRGIRHWTVLLIVAIAAFCLYSAAAAKADGTTVLVPYNQLGDDLFATAQLNTFQGTDRYQNLYEQMILQQLYQKDPNLSPDSAVKQIIALRNAVAQARTSQSDLFAKDPLGLGDTANTMLGVLKAIPGASAAEKFTYDFMDAAAKAASAAAKLETDPSGSDNTTYMTLNDQANQFAQTNQNALDIIQQSRDMANGASDGSTSANRMFANAWNELYAAKSDCSVTCNADQLISSVAALRNLNAVQWMVNNSTNTIRDDIKTSTGQIRVDIAQMKSDVQSQFDQLNGTLDGMNQDIQDLAQAQQDGNANFQAFVDRYNSDQAYQAEQQAKAAQAKQDAENRQTNIAGAQGAVFLLSKFLGAADPVLGNDIFTVGNSLIQIADTTNSMIDLLGSAAEATVNPLAFINLGAKLVSAVLPIVGLFGGPSGPSPDQIILDEVQKTQKEISALHTDMEERFNRVDQALNTIFGTLVTDFNQVDTSLGYIQGDVQDLKTGMWNLQLSVDNLERDMHATAEDQTRRDLWQNIDEALHWNQIQSGTPMPSTRFADFNSFFYTYAVRDSFDQVALAPDGRSTDDMTLATELTKYPLEENINYFGDIAAQRFGISLFLSKLPNPRDWALGARAYANLALQQPALAAHSASSRFDDILNLGESLSGNLGRISHSQTLFDDLFADYKQRLSDLNTALQNSENAYYSTHNVRSDLLFKGVNSELPAADQPQFPNDKACSDPLATPSNGTADAMVPLPLQYANRLGAGKVQVCQAANWVNTQTTGSDADRSKQETGQLQVTITAQYQQAGSSTWQTFRSRSYTSPKSSIVCYYDDFGPNQHGGEIWKYVCDPAMDNADSAWTTGTPTLKSSFEGNATTTDTQSVIDGGTSDAIKQQAAYVADLYSTLQTQMGQTGAPVHNTTLALGGSKDMLTGFIQLGFPTSLGGDQLMLALLSGSASLDDNQGIANNLVAAIAALPASGTPSTEQIPDVRATIFAADTAAETDLQSRLNYYLGQVKQGSLSEYQPLIAHTNRAIALAQTVTYWPPPQSNPGGGASNPSVGKLKLKLNGKTHSVTFTFTLHGGSGAQCALVKAHKRHHHAPKPSFSSCHSPANYHNLKPGHYTFYLRALGSGNSRSPASSRSFQID